MVETWGEVPDYAGRGRPPTKKQPQPGWNYVQVIKHRSGYRLTGITIKVIYGDPEEALDLMGGHTAYIERTSKSPDEWTIGQEEAFFLQGPGDAGSRLRLGRLGL
jgi:hypothetical protein